MKKNLALIAVLVIALSGAAVSQSAPNNPQPSAMAGSNPVTGVVRTLVARQQRNIIGAAELMPAEKYSYSPTPGQISYAKLMAHIAESNNLLCSKIGDLPAPTEKVSDADGKDKIVAAIKASFDFCGQALQKTDDSKLGDQVTLFQGRQVPRAYALIALTNDFADHYSAAAGYLRLNGLTPPSAQPQSAAKPAAPTQRP